MPLMGILSYFKIPRGAIRATQVTIPLGIMGHGRTRSNVNKCRACAEAIIVCGCSGSQRLTSLRSPTATLLHCSRLLHAAILNLISQSAICNLQSTFNEEHPFD